MPFIQVPIYKGKANIYVGDPIVTLENQKGIIIHGYDYMKCDRGPIPYCEKCDNPVLDAERSSQDETPNSGFKSRDRGQF